ncbi:uncharacterized protein LOC141588275 [Silene latifolia]|uniref:uncharacterized protein LOC141588275 n=1 Tax=Silene latifolia TaxID=37657 RepID=UPI003D7714A3
MGFKFYLLSSSMRLSYLMFADDILLFSKGDASSMMIIIRTFSTFSATSGLRMSKGKSNVYFNGVSEALKADFLQVSGLVEGRLPFRYLEVPIKTTRLNAQDCKPLFDKIMARIRILGIGNCHMQEVAWICSSVVRWIYTKPDLLWVKWVSNIYLRGSAWQDYSPSTNSSWYQRKICQVKDDFHQAYQQQNWVPNGNGYTISNGYEFLRLKSHDVPWSGFVWNVWTIPKHGFIAWIYHHGNMNTKSKLHRLGIREDSTCCICGIAEETMEHLFFDCPYSKCLLLCMGAWMGINFPVNNLLTWRLGRSGSQVQKEILDAAINACIYNIWHQRNRSKHELVLVRPNKLARLIMEELKMIFRGLDRRNLNRREEDWFQELLRRGS